MLCGAIVAVITEQCGEQHTSKGWFGSTPQGSAQPAHRN